MNHKPYGSYEKYFKRLLDIVCSLAAIIVFSWLYIILIILGAIFMRGNPFFTQERPGKDEKIFKLIKFRSMDNRKDKNGNLLPDEVRLNKYGQFLRKTSLDELPEAFNILKGDMSIIGPRPLLVSYLPCEMSLDKFEMYNWLAKNGYKCAKSYMDKDAFFADVEVGLISYPVFVKPARGSASISISKAYDKETVELLFAHEDGLMIQEFLNGQEIGADVYIDMVSHEIVSIFTKKKLKMRAGETDKAVSFKDKKLFDLIEDFVKKAGYNGQIDIDIFDVNGEYYISEVNPRFGGGYPHAYESGANHMCLIVNNLAGRENECAVGKNYKVGTYMMKYNEIMIQHS